MNFSHLYEEMHNSITTILKRDEVEVPGPKYRFQHIPTMLSLKKKKKKEPSLTQGIFCRRNPYKRMINLHI